MKKHLLALLLAAALLLSLLPSALADDGDGNIGGEIFEDDQAVLTIPTVTAEPGQRVTIPVILSGNPGIAGLTLKITCPAGMTLEAIRPTDLLGVGQWTCSPQEGTATWTHTGNLLKNGQLLLLEATLSHQALPGTGQLTVEATGFVNSAGGNVPVKVSGGTVTVQPVDWSIRLRLWGQTADLTITCEDSSVTGAMAVLACWSRENRLLSAHGQTLALPTAQPSFQYDKNTHHATLYLLHPDTLRPLTPPIPLDMG